MLIVLCLCLEGHGQEWLRLGLHPAPGMCRLTVGMVVEGGMMFGRGHRADIVEEC